MARKNAVIPFAAAPVRMIAVLPLRSVLPLRKALSLESQNPGDIAGRQAARPEVP
jgi:hypothetical protein